MLIDRKQFDSGSSLQQTAFVMKEEFRTMMIAIFILFEYNLKFILVDELVGDGNRKEKNNE